MNSTAEAALATLRTLLRPASVAQVGGFRPPDDPCASWFGRGVALPHEPTPQHDGQPMLPLLQVNVAELPFVPDALQGVALLVVHLNRDRLPLGKAHGDGWLIREYAATDGLIPLPPSGAVKPFPIRWSRVDDDAPGWEDAWSLLDLSAVNDDDDANEAFSDDFARYSATKVGGYPYAIQHAVGLDGFVFQIGSEEKAGWMWADNGIGYFFKTDGVWRWDCQFY